MTLKDIYLYFENGIFIKAKSFGAEGTSVGEVVFNTSLTGYQEIISDPSYAGQFVTFTMSEIGNVGANAQDMESDGAFTKGIIVRNFNSFCSNFRAEEKLEEFLKRNSVMGITNIDTRKLTKMLRNEGAMMMIASTDISNKDELAEKLKNSPHISEINYIEEVGTRIPYVHESGAYDITKFDYFEPKESKAKILTVDFGVKKNILNEFVQAGVSVEVIPSNFNVDEVISRFKTNEIQGIFLSNGPGDPLVLKDESEKITKLVEAKVPMFGICLGHQLLSIANGYPTHKLKFGHHGGNHPVKNLKTGVVEITAQNHNYSVPDNISEIADVTHKNLFDDTIEGVIYKNSPIFSVQHHPESSPGPHESNYIFKQFVDFITQN
jgi:carbamoyl-phosphate synthase small subunit